MSPEQIKALRKELGCTSRQLAEAVGVDQKTILAWEAGSLFPTKKFVERMAKVQQEGHPALAPKNRARPSSAMHALADPDLWALVRKLLAHEKLRAEVARLAASYEDPADESG